MATSGTNYTAKWTLVDGVLTISPVSGNSGIARKDSSWGPYHLTDYITLTEEEKVSVNEIVFVGDISFMYKPILSDYIKQTEMSSFFSASFGSVDFPNLQIIDVGGLNTTNVTDFDHLFSEELTQIRNLASLDVSSGTSFAYMFSGCRLSALDLSSYPLNNARISGMITNMNYCETVILPSGFAKTDNGTDSYSFGLATNLISATKGSVTVSSDENFFKLDSAQGGTWTRDISGTASLSFRITSTSRDANIGTINYTYATTSATANIYLKKTSDSSFPSTASETITLTGSGSGSIDITLPTDDAYDIKVIVSDGTTSIYSYPSVSSNILLFDVDDDGNLEVAGDYYSKVNQISLGTYITGGVLTGGGSYIHFSIPTGRVFPDGTTISKLTFNIVVRAGNHNASGLYVVKNASGGTDVKYYDSTASFQFYNGANQSKTLTTAMSNITLQGGTNIYVSWHGSGDYFFTGSSTNTGYVNNQPIVIMLTNITANLNIPS